jgi:hypothetical protein
MYTAVFRFDGDDGDVKIKDADGRYVARAGLRVGEDVSSVLERLHLTALGRLQETESRAEVAVMAVLEGYLDDGPLTVSVDLFHRKVVVSAARATVRVDDRAQSRDALLQRVVGVSRRVRAPHHLQEPVDGHRFARMQRQCGEQRPLAPCHLPLNRAVLHRRRPQQPHFHWRSCLQRSNRSSHATE